MNDRRVIDLGVNNSPHSNVKWENALASYFREGLELRLEAAHVDHRADLCS
jgi:hypothetical protein